MKLFKTNTIPLPFLVISFSLLGGFFGLVQPITVHAETPAVEDAKLKEGKLITITTPDKIAKNDDKKLISGLLNGTYTILAIVAVIVIVVAGIMYITSDGDSSKTATAKQAVIYALVGLAIVGSAFIITGVIQGIGTK